MIPQRMSTIDPTTGIENFVLSKRIFPILSNPFARTVVLCSFGIAIMSWGQQELERKRRLTPLPLSIPYESVSRVFLPPFLPEEVPDPEIDALHTVGQAMEYTNDESNRGAEGLDDLSHAGSSSGSSPNALLFSKVPPNIRKYVDTLYESAVKPQKNFQYFRQEWARQRETRRREVAKIRRMTIYDELIALQAIKRQAQAAQHRKKSSAIGKPLSPSSFADQGNAGTDPTILGAITRNNTANTGYALVTGASQGIGRAIAVELARWEIPLVLVARDVNKLSSLAMELQACYGIQCCVLGADLSELDAAEKVYEATTTAGINVDILVNNVRVPKQ